MLDNKKFALNLNEKEGTIDYVLSKYNSEIEKAYYDKSVNSEKLKGYIRDLIMSMDDRTYDKKPAGVKKFLMNLNKQRTKDQIITYVWNAKLSGGNLGVLK